jgi:hypothetical protein
MEMDFDDDVIMEESIGVNALVEFSGWNNS